MPEPNLPPLHLQLDGSGSSNRNVLSVPEIQKSMPEMPTETRDRLVRDFGLSTDFAFRFVNDLPVLNFFLEAVQFKPDNVKVRISLGIDMKVSKLSKLTVATCILWHQGAVI